MCGARGRQAEAALKAETLLTAARLSHHVERLTSVRAETLLTLTVHARASRASEARHCAFVEDLVSTRTLALKLAPALDPLTRAGLARPCYLVEEC